MLVGISAAVLNGSEIGEIPGSISGVDVISVLPAALLCPAIIKTSAVFPSAASARTGAVNSAKAAAAAPKAMTVASNIVNIVFLVNIFIIFSPVGFIARRSAMPTA